MDKNMHAIWISKVHTSNPNLNKLVQILFLLLLTLLLSANSKTIYNNIFNFSLVFSHHCQSPPLHHLLQIDLHETTLVDHPMHVFFHNFVASEN